MSRANRFRIELREEAGRLREAARDYRDAIALEALTRIVLRTPVDTGRARGSWIVSVGAPDTTITTNTDPSGQATIAEGQARLASAELATPVLIQSNLPYIEALEAGRSRQAPGGMIAITVAELGGEVRR